MTGSGKTAKGLVPSYIIDAGKSRFQVKAFATGLLSTFGHNPIIAIRDFTGEAWFREQAPEQSSLRIEIPTASLAIANNVSDKDRDEMERVMKQEVLETGRYAEIRFEGSGRQVADLSPGMYRITLGGKLSLHGVDRDVEFPCNVTVSEDSLRANGEFSIRQTDYDIKLVSVAGGTLRLKDELKFQFDIVARRRQDAGND
ncbi:MAG TPA: YceI family protein [Bryobacteraceae bacterium]|nr:YceI family protein [Bryobacteraceae bacterium]